MLRPIAIIQKKDRFVLGYKPDKPERQRFMEEKRELLVSLGRKKKCKNRIPPLSHTFRSAGFINPKAIWSEDKEISVDKAFGSLSIDMVEAEDKEARGT